MNLDDEEEPLVALPFPASTAFLALAFLACTLLVAGLPPLSSFVGKFAMLSGALSGRERGAIPGRTWLFLAVVLGSGFLSLVAMIRTGIRTFWSAPLRERPRIRLAEGLPIVALLAGCLGLALAAGPVSRYTLETAQALQARLDHVPAAHGGGAAPALGKCAR